MIAFIKFIILAHTTNMKKLLKLFGLLGMVAILTSGCATINKLTPTQISTIGIVITDIANQGATYAIQKDVDNATYFKLVNTSLVNFLLGTDLSPEKLRLELSKITNTNQWIGLAVNGVVFAYDISYQQYVVGHITNTPAAVAWITAIETGFKQALKSTGTELRASKSVKVQTIPYFIKDGKVDEKIIKRQLNLKY